MVKSVKIVIGAAFGDEGKGNTVDRMSGHNTVVVRFNGGAQASHTVERHGQRHAFSHYGSGSFHHAITYLGPEFIINPTVYRMETEELTPKGVVVPVYADPFCRVTTIYDMMYNQWLERQRGNDKHGSCGLGINATVDRHEIIPLYLNTADVASTLDLIRWYYDEKTDGMLEVPPEFVAAWIAEFNNAASSIRLGLNLHEFDHVVFEGAQGLMLDEFNGQFPHVTRSRTGTTNLYRDPLFSSVINECDDVTVLYVTRAYATRHGRGPFWDDADQGDWASGDVVRRYFDVVDKTNVPNPWQDTLRLAPINFEELKKFILADIAAHTDHLKVNNYGLVVTCLDQTSGTHVPVYNPDPDPWNNKYHVVEYGEFIYQLVHFAEVDLQFDLLITAYGHREFDIELLKENVV